MSDSLFSIVGFFFFAVWSIVVGSFTIAAFGADLLRVHARIRSVPAVLTKSAGAAGARSR